MSNAATAALDRPADAAALGTAVGRPIDTVRNALEKMKPQFAMALPKHLTPDRLLRVAITAIQNTPKLLDCDRTSLYSAIMTCAQLGLEPDGILGQAYLVPFAGKVQFIPGYKGLILLARNSGEVISITAHEVRRLDRFIYSFGLNESCEHVPATGDRGEIEFFYAVAKFKDGGHHFDVMTKADVDAIRDASKGYQASKRYAKNGLIDSPWEQHYAEMGKKTVVRRIAKYLPMNVQKAAALADSFDSGRHATLDVHGEVVIDGESHEQADTSRQIAAGSKLDRFEERTAEEPAAEQEQPSDPKQAVAAPSQPPPLSPLKAKAADRGDAAQAWVAWFLAEAPKASAEQRPDFIRMHGEVLDWIAANQAPDWQRISEMLDGLREMAK